MNLKHDKEKILSAGQTLFRAQGYHGTGINEILRESGVSKGSFYNYFKSKEAFAIEVLGIYGQGTAEMIAQGLSDTSASALDRIRGFVEILFAFQAAENFENGCLVYNLSFEMAGKNSAIAQTLESQIELWIDLIEPVVQEGQEAGQITDRHAARDLAMMIHTAVNGAGGRMKIGKSVDPMRQMLDITLDLIAA